MGVKQIIIRSERDEKKISDLCELDPAFYKKIISRSSSARHARQNSTSRFPGKIPFRWELQPGKPRDASSIEIQTPIRFPPAVHSLTIPKPCLPPTGPKAFFLRNIKNVKKITSLQIGKSLTVPRLSKKISNINLKEAKEYFLKNIKKMETVKNVFHAKRVGKKSREIEGKNDDGDDVRFSNFDEFVPPFPSFDSSVSSSSSLRKSSAWSSMRSPVKSSAFSSISSSSSSSLSSSSSSSLQYCAVKSPKTLRIWSSRKGIVKMRVECRKENQ